MAKNLMRFGLVLVGISGLQHLVNAVFSYSIVDKIASMTAPWVAPTLFVVAGGASILYAVTEWK